MARPLRIQFPGAIYHVMVRGNERRRIFKDDRDRRRLLDQLAHAVELHGVRLYLACLMPNHVHLLLETPRANLSAFMRQWLTGYTVYFNRRHRRVGHLTQGRYKAQLVDGDAYLLKLSRYIHLNPVCGKRWEAVAVRERRQHLRAYPWSTYRSYAGLEPEWAFIDYGPLRALGEGGRDRVRAYKAFVESGLARSDAEFGELYRAARLSLGSKDFDSRVRLTHWQAAARAKRPEDVALRRVVPGLKNSKRVLAEVAAVLGVEQSELGRRRRNSMARAVASWALVRHAGLTQREAARVLGLESGAAVSQQLTKWRQATKEERWRRVAEKLDRKLNNANC